jgi:predicted alpha-1,6-mannanase (GH76 family)
MKFIMDILRTSKKITDRMKQAQKILDIQVLKDSNYFAPMDEGTLIASGVTATVPGSGWIVWNTPYAKKLYYGVGFNFSKDDNPNARAKWFEEAKALHKKDWLEVANDAYNR